MYQKLKKLNIGRAILLFFVFCLIIQLIRYNIYESGRYHIKTKEDVIQHVIKDKEKLNALINNKALFNNENVVFIYGYRKSDDYYKKYKNKLLDEMFYNYKINTLHIHVEDNENTYIEFVLARRFTIAVEHGFYYTENDKPRAWQSDNEDRLIASGDGYTDKMEKEYYTEKIMDHWYYYQMDSLRGVIF